MAKTKNYELFVVGTGEDPYVKDFISQLCGEEASNMTIIDEKLNSLDQVVENLKTSVSEGKTLIASAVTDMGIQTADDASFAQIASNISRIETGVDTSDATAIETDIKYGKTAYVDGQRIDGKLVPSEIISSGAEVSYKYGEALVEIMMSDGYIESPGSFHVGHVMPVSEMTIAGPIPPITRLESGIRVDVTVTEGVTQNKTVEKYIYPTWDLGNALNATIDFDPDTAQFTTTPSISNMNGPEKTFRLVTTSGSTVMPSTTTQEVVPEHVWTLEPINIAGDTNLISENIKNGITIFGVEGSLQSGIDTSTSSTLPTCEVTIENTSSYVIMGTAVDENNQTLSIHWNDNSSTRSFTTSHPFFLIYQQDADISMSMTGVSDLGTSTNNTFETVYVHSFKPTSSSATITIS